jgi:opacity protein-like surface antigen
MSIHQAARPFLAASIATLSLLIVPAHAHADGLLVPFIGSDFGGDAGQCNGLTDCSTKQLTYGLSFGFMAGGVFGFETEIAHAPHFFGDAPTGSNYVFTGMVNLLVGIPIGPVRPYFAGGVGVIHTDVSASSTFAGFGDNSFGFNTGGGLYGFFSQHVGLRGDIRYVRTLQNINFPQFGIGSRNVDFWRGSLGVAFRF